MIARDFFILAAVAFVHWALLTVSVQRSPFFFARPRAWVEVSTVTPTTRRPRWSGPVASMPWLPAVAAPAVPPPAGSPSTESRTTVSTEQIERWGNELPSYPEDARLREDEGTAVLDIDLDRDGLARRVALFESSGVPSLDRAALDSARRWRFRSSQSAFRVRVEFTLQ